MTSYASTLVTTHVKLCSIDVAQVLKKGAMLKDSLELTKSIRKELEAQSSQHKFLEAVGVVVMLTSMVSDILMDTYGAVLGKSKNPLVAGLSWAHDKASEGKWKGNLYEKEIERIKKAGGWLETCAKRDKTGMIGMAVKVHKSMLMNMTGLVGHTEGSKQSHMVLMNAIKTLQKNIDELERQSRNNQFYLDAGEGAAPEQRFTPMPTAVPLG